MLSLGLQLEYVCAVTNEADAKIAVAAAVVENFIFKYSNVVHAMRRRKLIQTVWLEATQPEKCRPK